MTPVTEIERKFLLASMPEALGDYPHVRVFQGYLALDPDGTEVRIRKVGAERWQTIKRGAGLARMELQIPLTSSQFATLWPLTEGRRVEKTRYDIVSGQHTIEVDVYGGALAGLLTAEVEFDSLEASAAFRPALWLGTEITEDGRYKNKHLAQYGLPSG